LGFDAYAYDFTAFDENQKIIALQSTERRKRQATRMEESMPVLNIHIVQPKLVNGNPVLIGAEHARAH
jgi:hypothetical protein